MRRGSPNLAIAEASPHVARALPIDPGFDRSIAIHPGRPAARPRVQAGRPARHFLTLIKPFCGTHPVTPSTRFGLPKLWRRAAARPATQKATPLVVRRT